MRKKIDLVWFKRDLSTHDHDPLYSASKMGPVMCLYIIEPELWKQPDLSYRHYEFLIGALKNLNEHLKTLNSSLLVKVGNSIEVFESLAMIYQIDRVWSHQETSSLWCYNRDLSLRGWLNSQGIQWIEKPRNGVVRSLSNRDIWSKKWYASMNSDIIPTPKKIISVSEDSDQIPSAEALKLDISQKKSSQVATRSEGLSTLSTFLQFRGRYYTKSLSSPVYAESSCSRLSPYLAFGLLSIKEIFQESQKQQRGLSDLHSSFSRSLISFSSRLRWHCHFIQKLEDQPNIETKTLHSSFENLRPSSCDYRLLNAWENGNTGYPMIDACMRYLNATGWLNFRMRAMLVSFASYHLWLDWRHTAPHLARQFLDYEPGIHYSQIQMQSGTTGMNSIRIYNPTKQGMDQDPDGKFIRKWVPELNDIPKQFIHQPWLLEDSSLNYPKPIVDEKLARTAAQEKIYSLKKQIKNSVETASLVQKHASRLNRRPRRKLKSTIPLKQQLSLDL